MGLLLTASGLCLALLAALYRFVVQPALLSPLAKIPAAHPLCTITERWFRKKCETQKQLKTLLAAHQKHGPVIRLGPAEVSVASPEGLQAVYRTPLEKDIWYLEQRPFDGVPNLVSMLDNRTHGAQKRMITGVYAKSYLQHSPEMDCLSKTVVHERLIPLLQHSASTSGPIDAFALGRWVAVDMTTGYLLGRENMSDFFTDVESRENYCKKPEHAKGIEHHPYREQMAMQMTRKAAGSLMSRNDGTSSPAPVVFSKLYQGLSATVDTEKQFHGADIMTMCASEMYDHIFASADTTATTLTYACWHLSRQPALQDELRIELRTLQPTISPVDNGVAFNQPAALPTPSSIDSSPLLNAILMETLRLHATAPARLPRVVPVGGIVLHGYHIPAGTVVSSNAYTLHRHEPTYPEPLAWRPQRWLSTDNPELMKEMHRRFWAFGSGGRMCIGSHFATQMLKLTIAAIYTSFRTSTVDDEGIEQRDDFLSYPVGEKLILQVEKVQ